MSNTNGLSSELELAELDPLAKRIIANEAFMNSVVGRLTDEYAASYINDTSGQAEEAYDRATQQVEQMATEMMQGALGPAPERSIQGAVQEVARERAVQQVMLEIAARAEDAARERGGLPTHEEALAAARNATTASPVRQDNADLDAVLRTGLTDGANTVRNSGRNNDLDPVAKSIIANEDFSNGVVNRMSKAFLNGDVNAAMTQARQQIKEMAMPAVGAAGPEGEQRVNEIVQQVMSEYQGRADAIVADVNHQARPDRQDLDPAAPDKLEAVRRAQDRVAANGALDANPPAQGNQNPDKLEAVRRANERVANNRPTTNSALGGAIPVPAEVMDAIRMAGVSGGAALPNGAIGQLSAPDTPNGNAAQTRNR